MDLKNKRVLVVGLGKSGVASALFLRRRGAEVTVSDSKTENELRGEIPKLLDQGITVEAGGHGERTFHKQNLIVVSPGVPVDVPQLSQARQLGIPIIGEIELASRFLKGQIVAITGSNGKTTTTALTGEVLAQGGKRTLVGGNIGTPAISLADESTDDTYVVLEVSSFQLETIEKFHPKIAVLLNITPDHLDRHADFQAYVDAKARIFENQTADDFTVLNADDAQCAGLSARTRARKVWFSLKRQVEEGACVKDSSIIFRSGGLDQEIVPVKLVPLKGGHNLANVLATVCVGMLAKVAPQHIRKAVEEFKAVEHRLEYVATVQGVEFYNDSKATNVDATIKALESFPANIHVILGGKDKGSDYSVLNQLLRQRAKCVYTIGTAAQKIASQISNSVMVVHAEKLETAVRRAASAAVPGDFVLLAPACASFDQFENYEHRGRVFKQAVRAIADQAKVGSAT